MNDITIIVTFKSYIEEVAVHRSQTTVRSCSTAINRFISYLGKRAIDVHSLSSSQIQVEWGVDYFRDLKNVSPSTFRVYFWAIFGWYRYLGEKGLVDVNLSKLKQLIKPYFPKPESKPQQEPNYYDISRIVDYAINLTDQNITDELEKLRILRDRALIITLADTGLEALTISRLRKSNVDWPNNRFVLTVKGKTNVHVIFPPRVSDALAHYLDARISLDKATGRPINSLPLFAGHRHRNQETVLALGTRRINTIVGKMASAALGSKFTGSITPISFRKYSTASLLRPLASLHPKVIKKCQVHFENGHYDDAIFNAMKVVEEEVRLRISATSSEVGVNLVTRAMQNKPVLITFSSVLAEQESAYYLFRGAIGSFKNPHSHRYVGVSDPIRAFECIALASLLMKMLDEAT